MPNPYKPIVWDSFSQQPIRPEFGENPVTRVVNMELTPEKTIRTRRGFSEGLNCTAPDSHVTAHLIGSDKGSDLILKVGTEIKKKTSATGTANVVLGSDIHYKTLTDGPGYFSVYGGEVYFCQSVGGESDALFSIDGDGARTLGLPPITGGYGGSPNSIEIRSAIEWDAGQEWCGYYCAPKPGTTAERQPPEGYKCCTNHGDDNGNCGFDDWVVTGCEETVSCQQPNELCSASYNTFLCHAQQGTVGGLFCWHVAEHSAVDARGEKILNCAFKVSYYDPKRNIYGKACTPKSVINFGPNRDQYTLYQYQILADKPDHPDHLGFAIWCSIGQEVLTVKIPKMNFWNTILYDEVHGMSDHLTDMMFLEDRTNKSGIQEVQCYQGNKMCLFKDQATLADSGQYTDQYDRPVPAKAMAILPGGTALYFYPREVTDVSSKCEYTSYDDDDASYSTTKDHRPGIEYSVGHPEQIGRNTYNQKETFAPLPSLRGEPMYSMSTGGASVLFTRQTIYQLGFDRSPQVREFGGPGVMNYRSIHPTSGGVMYVADEGPVWFQGSKAVEILRELRFEGWMEPLTQDQKDNVRVGMIEDCKKLLVSFPVEGTTDRYKLLMHDFNDGFTSEWWLGGDQKGTPNEIAINPGSSSLTKCMLSHKGDDGYSFYIWLGDICYRYDPTTGASEGSEPGFATSYLEFWINENPHLEKQLGEVVLHLGKRSGSVTVRVSTFENPNDRSSSGGYSVIEERTRVVTTLVGQRVAMPDFSGMRGKYFRITIEAPGVEMELSKVVADIKYDEDPRTDDTGNVLTSFPGT